MFRRRGFTLIELLVVVAIIALLMSIVAPRYWSGIDRTKEAVLREDLYLMRDQINKFFTDTGRYPDHLNDLVTKQYLRSVPEDPITERTDTWILLPPANPDLGHIADVRSGASGTASDGKPLHDL